MNCVRVPRGLIEDKSLGDKRVLVYASISFSRWNGNMNELASSCGYSVDRHNGAMNQQIASIVHALTEYGYAAMHSKTYSLVRHGECFGMIYKDEYEKIMNARKLERERGHRMNHAHALLLLSCIRCYMLKTKGKPRIYSNLLVRISENIGLSVRSISGCIRLLEDLDIIHSEELPRYKSNGSWHSNVHIFVNRQDHSPASSPCTYDWQNETKRGINMILASQMC